MRILLLDNYDSFTYNIAQILDESKLCTFEIIKNDKITIYKASTFDKIILSPGPGIPSEAGKMNEIINYFYKKKPFLGICLGMQAIAEFFGGTIYNMNKIFHGIKEKTTIDSNSVLFKNLNHIEKVGLYHSWAVSKENFPKTLKTTAISENNIVMALEHKNLPIFGVQFHPESYMTENGKLLIENWLRL